MSDELSIPTSGRSKPLETEDVSVTMPLDRVQIIVEHLLKDGSREGLILGDELNVAMGASARRRAARAAVSPPATEQDVIDDFLGQPMGTSIGTSYGIKVDEPKGAHTRVRIFAGPDEDHRAMAGELILRTEEVDDLRFMIETWEEARVAARAIKALREAR